jgi:predicted small lipoprotein YifL
VKQEKKWILFLIAAAMIPLTACGTKSSNLVLPPLEHYTAEVQNRAADELEALGPPCPRTEVTPDCSAVKTLINDYKTMRDRIRVIK